MSGKYLRTSVPIFVSLTGHMDIDTEEGSKAYIATEEALVKVIGDIRKSLGEDTDIYLMTGLAPGADIASSLIALRLGLGISPIIPKSLEAYRDQYNDAGYSKQFDDILRNSEELRPSAPKVLDPVILDPQNGHDGDRYVDQAIFMIKNSHVMIALWDGRPYSEAKRGGTYDTLRMAYSGIEVDRRMDYREGVGTRAPADIPINYLDTIEDCLIYYRRVDRSTPLGDLMRNGCLREEQISADRGYIIPSTIDLASREKDEDGVCEFDMGDGTVLPIRDGFPEYYSKMFSRIGEMNRTITDAEAHPERFEYKMGPWGTFWKNHWKRKLQEETRGSVQKLDLQEPDDAVKAVANDLKNGVLEPMARRTKIAATLADGLQGRSFRHIRIFAALTIFADILVGLYMLFSKSILFNIGYLVFLLVTYIFCSWHIKRNVFPEFIEYRSVSESMRVEYWRAVNGLSDQSQFRSYGYDKNGTYWVRAVLKSWCSEFLNDYDAVQRIDWRARMDVTEAEWIDGQIRYFWAKARTNSTRFRMKDRGENFFAFALVVISAVIVVLSYTNWADAHLISLDDIALFGYVLIDFEDVDFTEFLKVLTLAFTALAMMVSFEAKIIHGGKAGENLSKMRVFEIAKIRLSTVSDQGQKCMIIHSLGEHAIDENNEWVFDHKDRDIENKKSVNIRSLGKSRRRHSLVRWASAILDGAAGAIRRFLLRWMRSRVVPAGPHWRRSPATIQQAWSARLRCTGPSISPQSVRIPAI